MSKGYNYGYNSYFYNAIIPTESLSHLYPIVRDL